MPELARVALALVLFLFLGAFLLLVLWLPLLFLALNVLSLGELWRHYRTVWVHVLDGDPPRLRATGTDLLRKGGMVSKSWDR